jgi:hypothetical protein
MTGTNCDLFTHNHSRSYLNHLVLHILTVFIAIVIQNAQRIRRIILSSVTCLDVSYFTTLSNERHEFADKKVIGHNIAF